MYHLLRFLRVHVFSFECRSIDRVTLSSLFALMSDYDFVDRVVDVTSRYPRVDNRYVSPSITSILYLQTKGFSFIYIYLYFYKYSSCLLLNVRLSESRLKRAFILILWYCSSPRFQVFFFFFYLFANARETIHREDGKKTREVSSSFCTYASSFFRGVYLRLAFEPFISVSPANSTCR